MIVVRRIKKMQFLVDKQKKKSKSIGFVPTMGKLHQGHLSLIRRARKENDMVVVSIFVNPIQFGPREDFKKYPRDFKKDSQVCRREKVDVLFCPSSRQMYPQGFSSFVEVAGQSELLCGQYRPGHFRGVATVVAKLFNIIQPDTAYFGKKDYQQAVIIRKMVSDLAMPIEVRLLATVREKDGLALSSRNSYLEGQNRKDASLIYKALRSCEEIIKKGERNPDKIIKLFKKIISAGKFKVQYIQIVDPQTLMPLKKIRKNLLIVTAVYLGKTRLIDNIEVSLKN